MRFHLHWHLHSEATALETKWAIKMTLHRLGKVRGNVKASSYIFRRPFTFANAESARWLQFKICSEGNEKRSARTWAKHILEGSKGISTLTGYFYKIGRIFL